jgi:hypothetical protein
VRHSRSGAHHLHVTRRRAALVAKRILVRDRASADVGHDFHVAMRMRRKAALRSDLVVVPYADPAPGHALGVVIVREGEMVAGVEPAVVGVAEAAEGADIDHETKMGAFDRCTRVTADTVLRRRGVHFCR